MTIARIPRQHTSDILSEDAFIEGRRPVAAPTALKQDVNDAED